MSTLHSAIIRLTDTSYDYSATWHELQVLNLLVGKEAFCGYGASMHGSVMGWDAALDTLAHSALAFMAIADTAQHCANTRQVSWSVVTQIDDVLIRAAPIGENAPGSLLGSLCKLDSSADTSAAVTAVKQKLETQYYPLIGAIMSQSQRRSLLRRDRFT
eukprot:1248114-Amphidinium_carterae.1